MIHLELRKIRKDAILWDTFDSSHSAFNVRTPEEVVIAPGKFITVDTGIAYQAKLLSGEVIYGGYEIQIRARNCDVLRGLYVPTGTVDAQYRGSVGVTLHNLTAQPIVFKVGEPIALAVVCPVGIAHVSETQFLSDTDRAGNGFGSTGT